MAAMAILVGLALSSHPATSPSDTSELVPKETRWTQTSTTGDMPWSSTSQISTTFLLLLLLLSGDVETNPGPATGTTSTNWAELVINTAGKKVQYGKNDPRRIMMYGNHPKTR